MTFKSATKLGLALGAAMGSTALADGHELDDFVKPVKDNIALPFLDKATRAGLIDANRIGLVVDRQIRETSTRTSSPDQEIHFLSGDHKQKICFSRWFDDDLELLILLEPTRGIDVHAKADIYRIIEDLATRGVGVLILSYEIDEVIMLADRVITMYHGGSVAEYSHPNFDKEKMLADMSGAKLPATVHA